MVHIASSGYCYKAIHIYSNLHTQSPAMNKKLSETQFLYWLLGFSSPQNLQNQRLWSVGMRYVLNLREHTKLNVDTSGWEMQATRPTYLNSSFSP